MYRPNVYSKCIFLVLFQAMKMRVDKVPTDELSLSNFAAANKDDFVEDTKYVCAYSRTLITKSSFNQTKRFFFFFIKEEEKKKTKKPGHRHYQREL